MRVRTTVAAILAFSCLWASSALAQPANEQHVVNLSVMRQAIADQTVTDQQNREAVLGVLQHSDVRSLAGRLGLSVADAESAVSALSGAELAGLAGTARMADVQLSGGSSTVVISLTTLLLILIIVILVV